MSKKIYVYECFFTDTSNLMGYLYVDVVRGTESYSFEYNKEWLNNNSINFIDPDLSFYNGRQYPIEKEIFGLFSDSMPDRWGRILMKRKESIIAEAEQRKPNKLFDSDFLLGVYDETRMGAIRFKLEENGDFISSDKSMPTPPWKSLRELEDISLKIDSNEAIKDEWLNILIKPGSSLGGARPKANVYDEKGNLWIAKFPSKNDEYNVGAWEKVASALAKMCGLNVPESRLERFSKYGDIFIVKRFDRNKEKRIHYSSAMTMLGKTDGASSKDGSSYLDIVSFIKSFGSNPKEDIIELWKRIVFNIAISNTDDHLRNHGFILDRSGWRLSPLFDINPVPYGNELSLLIDNVNSIISVDIAIEASKYYGLSKDEAKEIAYNILKIVNDNWRKLALKYNISCGEIRIMEPAFNECRKLELLNIK
ncbi:MAG: type II toxin-antitoxin system HipA family toxin [Acholeplasmatales bacterium]|nr:type II toxin-antitoxin system HipA family toxin [Acholeplasmatales bacterium]